MIEMLTALEWLNRQKKSALSKKNIYWVTLIADPQLVEDERQAVIQELCKSITRQRDVREQAEVLSHCGAWGFLGHQYGEAKNWLRKAAEYYKDLEDFHREAVILWMLSKTEQSLGEYRQAFRHARRARCNFIDASEECARLSDAPGKGWYDDRVLEMTCDLIASPRNDVRMVV
jgi:hypothetical protein